MRTQLRIFQKDIKSDAPKSILETEKTLKTLSSGQIYKKNQKPKKPKKKKTPLGCFLFLNPGFFPTLLAGD
jgi:hypothetical protein